MQSKDYTEKEAEGFIEAVQEITLSGVASKQDIQILEAKLQALESRLLDRINEGLNSSLKFQLIQTITIIGIMVTLFALFG